MSRYYRMTVEIIGSEASKKDAIIDVLNEFWNWEGFECETDIFATGEDNLYSGQSEEEFTKDLSHAVWEANGAFCQVKVSATCLEDLPVEVHELSEEDFKLMK